MRYIWQHIAAIISTYNGSMPLAHFIKSYFRQNPILGSRDRKMLSTMAYSWYRCSKGLQANAGPAPALLRDALTLCNSSLLSNTRLFDEVSDTPRSPFYLPALFPYPLPLSPGIDKDAWLGAMLAQPDLFIRIRKDKGKLVSLLNNKQIPIKHITDTCLALPNGAQIDGLLPEDSYVVQDASSQATGAFMAPGRNELWYDACSGAGGKSLLLKDLQPSVRLTVSDKRETIIYNLKKRIAMYGHHQPVAHVTDVADKAQLTKSLGGKLFDGIICDVPCSGSGTWARTPEQLYFASPAAIAAFPPLQLAIAANAAAHLKPGSRLIYITCSVFSSENEEVVSALAAQAGLHIASQQLINGIDMHADSMYVAVLEKE